MQTPEATAGRSACTPGWVCLGLWLVLAPPARAGDGLTLEAGGERAGVELAGVDSVWWAGRLQLEYRKEGRGGGSVAFEPQHRSGTTDPSVAAGGYRHLGPWTAALRAGATPGATFYYRWALEAELSRRVVGTWVAGTAYRRLEFARTSVDIWSPAVARYAPWGEAQARVTFVANQTLGTRSRSALLRALWARGPRAQLGGGVAFGENLFDVTALAGRPARGWVAFVHGRVPVGARESLGAELRLAHEDPDFGQAAVGLYFRRSF